MLPEATYEVVFQTYNWRGSGRSNPQIIETIPGKSSRRSSFISNPAEVPDSSIYRTGRIDPTNTKHIPSIIMLINRHSSDYIKWYICNSGLNWYADTQW